MEHQFVAKFFQYIDDDVLLQLLLVTPMAMEGELLHLYFVYSSVYTKCHGSYKARIMCI